ncbi:cytochrome c biogenesis CcdA family protein [Ralstonia solanacearum]|uniref:cytochrome c biogenesis CcdA family protein n=1 Tax=Ralstonia solanacearum TaxID=305 RepID=UPI001E38F312|nr:cytochrome c biogenesis CcdA family protein [Ralstonia solanacearum]
MADMEFGLATYGLGYVAGVLSTLSPCVLPLIPIVLAGAASEHRWGAAALTAGLALSFTAMGMFVATIGVSIGLDTELLRRFSAWLLMAAGSMLLVPALQRRLVTATAGVANAGQIWLSGLDVDGLRGQFVVGIVLGATWSPCVGPTLGAAVALAAQGRDLGKIALLMAGFGLGAGTPMILLGTLSRATLTTLRGRLLSAGKLGKPALGTVILMLGVLTLTRSDKFLETWVVNWLPAWLVDLTTRF